VLGSTNSAAIDIVAFNAVDMDPRTSPLLAAAVKRGLTPGDIRDIEVKGIDASRFPLLRFEPPTPEKPMKLVPGFVRRIASRVLGNQFTQRPVPSPERCEGCGDCVDICPRDCIKIENGIAVQDDRNCIRCYCCHETCPHRAIDFYE
jgi:ferredoxin